MTSTPPPAQPGRPVGQVIRPLRDLAAYAFVAAPALWLFVAVIRLIPSGDGQTFLTRTQNSFYSFVNVELIVLPLAAVLLATLIQPVHKNAKLITIVALIEYLVAAFFAIVFGFLIALVHITTWSALVAFEEFVVRAAWLVVFAAAAYATFLIWRNLFYTPKPKASPGTYGQPQQWQQQPYGQPGFQQPGQPGFQQPGQPGYPPPPGQPGYAQPQPGQWGQPPADQAWGSPTTAQPVSAQPASGGAPGTPPGPFAPAPGHQPAPGSYGQPAFPPPPAYGQPQPPAPPAAPAAQPPAPPAAQPQGSYSEPTQAIPRPEPEDTDRTRVVRDDTPPHQ